MEPRVAYIRLAQRNVEPLDLPLSTTQWAAYQAQCKRQGYTGPYLKLEPIEGARAGQWELACSAAGKGDIYTKQAKNFLEAFVEGNEREIGSRREAFIDAMKDVTTGTHSAVAFVRRFENECRRAANKTIPRRGEAGASHVAR